MPKPFLALLLSVTALTGCDNEHPENPTAATRDHINFTTHAEKEVANDVVMVDISIVRHGADVPAMTKETNTDTGWAMNLAKQAKGVESKTTSFSTSSSYSGDGTTPQTWDVSQGIYLESQDPQALSDLLGKLQEKAQIGNISHGISAGAMEAAKAEMTTAAMAKFREQAQKVAADMGYKQYEVVKLDIRAPDDEMPVQAIGNYKGIIPTAASPAFKPGNPVLEGGKEKLQMSIQAEIEVSGK
jgi:predicted secreted protein